MLCEIYCKQFSQKKISFQNGLNVILGTQVGDNSIGKSTLMLIVDFCFGGNTYTESMDIIENVGTHEIGFQFKFDGNDYFFLRENTDRNVVWKCNSSYEKIERITIGEYCHWLAIQYGLDLFQLSFRDAVGRYIRAYGKQNCDEKHPLNIIPNEPKEKAVIALLKLFDRYKVISDIKSQTDSAKDELAAFTKAQKHKFVAKITKGQYRSNLKEIKRLNQEIQTLMIKLNQGLLDMDSVISERAIEIKKQLSQAKRMRSKFRSRISTLNENEEYSFSETTKTFVELQHFFPQVDLRHISEIEDFHKSISAVFREELKNEKRRLQTQIKDLDSIITSLEEELKGLIQNPNISKSLLKQHAENVRSIERMSVENDAYEKMCILKARKRENEKQFKKVKEEQLGIVENLINMEMQRINGLLYEERYNPPVLHFTDSSYSFRTPDDTGTGIAYKGLVVYDLSVLNLTSLPILVHDSVVLKQISDNAIENIITQYTNSKKQVIIALDKQNSYSEKTALLLEQYSRIKLAPNGQELFGRSWGKQTN